MRRILLTFCLSLVDCRCCACLTVPIRVQRKQTSARSAAGPSQRSFADLVRLRNRARALFVTDKRIQRRHCRRSGDVDGVLELPGRRISVATCEPASVSLDVAIKLGAAALEN